MDPLYLETADGFKICPYDPSHVVASVRFIGHLMKCSKSSGKKHQVCPWNAQHHIVEPGDYNAHLSTCVFRTYVDQRPPQRYVDPSTFVDRDPEEDIAENRIVPDSDITDSDDNEPLNPSATSSNHNTPVITTVYRNGTTEPNEPSPSKSGIYGSIDEVDKGIGAIVDAFSSSSFSRSANGLAILQVLVDTIYKEAGMAAK